MKTVQYLIVGAGATGLSFARFVDSPDYLILERDEEIGGYCKTVKRSGFVWDYSGHFFHFNDQKIKNMIFEQISSDDIAVVKKRASIYWKDRWIDFPFQKNIHQLPKNELIDCIYDLWFRKVDPPQSFKEMLYTKFGTAIAEKFLIPYNEKLYATDLQSLDIEAMGRFFPHASIEDIIRNFKDADNSSYNDEFTYPRGGAIEYINAIASGLQNDKIFVNEPIIDIDTNKRLAYTKNRTINYQNLISSIPLPKLMRLCKYPFDEAVFSCNKVLVFNIGFDAPAVEKFHWAYFPQKDICFYRVGLYNNIFNTPRMSLYVEIGAPEKQLLGPEDIDNYRERIINDLRKVGIVTDHNIVDSHYVIMDPAYVHITQKSNAVAKMAISALSKIGIHSIGRYGGWKYCSIEDNIKEALSLAERLSARP